jgi:hypothetical protein
MHRPAAGEIQPCAAFIAAGSIVKKADDDAFHHLNPFVRPQGSLSPTFNRFWSAIKTFGSRRICFCMDPTLL